jgi:hypothetical protein
MKTFLGNILSDFGSDAVATSLSQIFSKVGQAFGFLIANAYVVDKDTGRVYVFYYDQGAAKTGDLTRVSYVFSNNGGKTWLSQKALTASNFKAGWGNDTGQPNLGDYNQAVAQGGEFFAVWAGTTLPGFTDGQPSGSMSTPDVFFKRLSISGGGEDVNVSLVAGLTQVSNVVTYFATVDLTKVPAGVKPGMTASVTIVVDKAEGVLNLPSAAVRGTGSTGTVTEVNGKAQTTKVVGLGLRGDTTTEITNGLNAGDTVVVSSGTVSGVANQLGGTGRFSGLFGGLGGARPMGGQRQLSGRRPMIGHHPSGSARPNSVPRRNDAPRRNETPRPVGSPRTENASRPATPFRPGTGRGGYAAPHRPGQGIGNQPVVRSPQGSSRPGQRPGSRPAFRGRADGPRPGQGSWSGQGQQAGQGQRPRAGQQPGAGPHPGSGRAPMPGERVARHGGRVAG